MPQAGLRSSEIFCVTEKLSSADAAEPVSAVASPRFNPRFEWLKWSKMRSVGGAFVALRMKKFIDPCQMKCLHKKILSCEKNMI